MVINLKELINEHPDCLSSGERLKAYLLDLYPNEFGRINILVSLFEYGITKKIEKGFEHNIDEINDYINKFIIDYGFQRKIAEECANIWIDAQTENLFENIDIINEYIAECLIFDFRRLQNSALKSLEES